MTQTMSRRAFLRGSCGVAIGVGFVSVGLPRAAHAYAPLATENAIAFCGGDMVQMLIYDRRTEEPSVREVAPGDKVKWSGGTSRKRDAGAGSLNGLDGAFSGIRNTNTPQLFAPWATVVPGTELPAFQGAAAEADRPDQWVVEMNGAPVEVVGVYRKAVPVHASTINAFDYAHTVRHMVTLRLGVDVPDGAEIRVSGPDGLTLAVTRAPDVVSEAVHVSQVGYAAATPKKGYVGLWLGHDQSGLSGSTDAAVGPATRWRLVDTASGSVAAEGALEMAKAGEDPHLDGVNFNGCDIYAADFSDVAEDGTYRLEVDGIGASVAFPIMKNPYAETLRLAARWYFHQRSGCAIEEPYGEGHERPRNGHPDDGLVVWQTDVKLGDTSAGYTSGTSGTAALRDQPKVEQNPNAWGGWHDAGDWDRRVQHLGAVHDMAVMIELFEQVRTLDMNIPESGKPFADPAVKARKNAEDLGDGQTVLPDLIHEALWGISLWRRTQGPNGEIIGGVEYAAEGQPGSVSWNPLQDSFAYGPGDWSAYRFVHGAAKLGWVIKTVCGDAVLGETLIGEAEKAWAWADSLWPERVQSVGGAENLAELGDEFMQARVAAAATLYRVTGDASARAAYEAHNPFLPRAKEGAVGARRNVFTYAAFDYVRAAREGRAFDPSIVVTSLDWTVGRMTRDKRIGADYGLHSTALYQWGRGWARFGPGSNWVAHSLGIEYSMNRAPKKLIRDAVVEGMWFALGCNPSNVSFIQGLGQRQFSDPLGLDHFGPHRIPGHIVFGVAGGEMYEWEQRRSAGTLYPADQKDWPIYTQIYEAKTIAVCAEHGMRSNAKMWLFAAGFVNELLEEEFDEAPETEQPEAEQPDTQQ
jgi:endoglucanase